MIKTPLYELTRSCTGCELIDTCKGPVPAIGDIESRVMIVGEAPAPNEGEGGEPWKGHAGQYLDALLAKSGLHRNDVILTNVTKCKPSNGDDPTREQANFCADRWLAKEVELFQPEIIMTLGKAATDYFVGEGETIEHRHGIPQSLLLQHDHEHTPVDDTTILPAYHPSSGFYETANMRFIQDDFAVLGKLVNGEAINRPTDTIPPAYFEAERGWESDFDPALESGVIGLDTEIVEGKLWSVQTSAEPGQGVFFNADDWDNNWLAGKRVTVHNYMFDSQFVDLPEETDDTMVMAYVLGLPQGLKELAWRLCGMEMKSYMETISGHRKDKAMAYLKSAVPESSGMSDKEEDFWRFHQAHPDVYQVLCQLARDWKENSQKRKAALSMRKLYEDARWMTNVGADDESYRLPNNHIPFYSRLVMEREEDLAGMFQTKKQKHGDGNPLVEPELGVSWSDPPLIEDLKWDSKTQSYGTVAKTPQHITKKIKRIITDVESGKEGKNGPVDPWERWQKFDPRERAEIERDLGRMPDAHLGDIPRDEAVYYSARDPDASIRVRSVLNDQIDAKGLRFAYEIDRQTLPIAREMEKNGIRVNLRRLAWLSASYTIQMQEKSEEIFSLLDIKRDGVVWRFNPNSDNELRKLFFVELGFRPTKLTKKTRLPSVEGDELAKIDHPVVKLIEEYRHLAHLKSSFSDPLQKFADKNDRIHTTVKTTRTGTGRWSMAKPNLMQIPTRTELGRQVREAFEAEVGFKLFTADYSQIEMRVVAHLSNCIPMIQMFKDGRDIHTETAAEIFGVRPEDVTSAQRNPSKTTGFGVVYGLTAMGLYTQMQSEGLDQYTESDCEKFIKEYYRTKPGLKTWQDKTLSFARLNGYVADMFGRIRYTPEMLCPIPRYRGDGERKAINMPVQSTAQGILKLAMVNIWREMRKKNLPMELIRWLLQIHDELIWEIPTYMIEVWKAFVTDLMEKAVSLSVPVKVESGYGDNWSLLK